MRTPGCAACTVSMNLCVANSSRFPVAFEVKTMIPIVS
jgi:hypothetical protein